MLILSIQPVLERPVSGILRISPWGCSQHLTYIRFHPYRSYPRPKFYIPLLLTSINRTTSVLFQDPLLDNAPDLVSGYILIVELDDTLKIWNSN